MLDKLYELEIGSLVVKVAGAVSTIIWTECPPKGREKMDLKGFEPAGRLVHRDKNLTLVQGPAYSFKSPHGGIWPLSYVPKGGS